MASNDQRASFETQPPLDTVLVNKVGEGGEGGVTRVIACRSGIDFDACHVQGDFDCHEGLGAGWFADVWPAHNACSEQRVRHVVKAIVCCGLARATQFDTQLDMVDMGPRLGFSVRRLSWRNLLAQY